MSSKYNSLAKIVNHLKVAQKTKIKFLQIQIKQNGALSYKVRSFLNSILNILLTWGYLFGHKFLLHGGLWVALKYSNSNHTTLIQKTKIYSPSSTNLVRLSRYTLAALFYKNPQSLFILETAVGVYSGESLIRLGLGGTLLLRIN
jgi:ribosomal protein S8